MVKKETTGKRPSVYSEWHRERLPNNCYANDVDWVESRIYNDNGHAIPVALIETSAINYEYINPGEDPFRKTLWYVLKRTRIQRTTLERLASGCGIESYIVIHGPIYPLKKFLVLHITDELNSFDWESSKFEDISRTTPILMEEKEYIKFLVDMRRYKYF